MIKEITSCSSFLPKTVQATFTVDHSKFTRNIFKNHKTMYQGRRSRDPFYRTRCGRVATVLLLKERRNFRTAFDRFKKSKCKETKASLLQEVMYYHFEVQKIELRIAFRGIRVENQMPSRIARSMGRIIRRHASRTYTKEVITFEFRRRLPDILHFLLELYYERNSLKRQALVADDYIVNGIRYFDIMLYIKAKRNIKESFTCISEENLREIRSQEEIFETLVDTNYGDTKLSFPKVEALLRRINFWY